MKKIASFLMGFVVLATTSFAQSKMQSKKANKAPMAQSAPAQEAKQTPAPKMKKDGTPDKRFKGNKSAEGPMKKDGTKDMRYKKNKMAAKKAA